MLPFYTYLFKHAIPITVGPEWHATHEPIRNVYTFLGDNSSLTFSTNFSLVSKSSPYPTYISLSEKSSPISSFNFSISVGIIFLLPLTWVYCLTNPSSILSIGFILSKLPTAALVPDILPPLYR